MISTTETGTFRSARFLLARFAFPKFRAPRRTKKPFRTIPERLRNPSADLFSHAESIDAGLRISLARAQHGGRKILVIRRIGKILGLEGYPRAEIVPVASFADLRPVHKIPAVKLQAGLIGFDLHHDPRCGFVHFGGHAHFVPLLVQHPVVIVSASQFHRFEIGVDPTADRLRHPEVKRRSGYRIERAGRNQSRIGRRKPVGMDR